MDAGNANQQGIKAFDSGRYPEAILLFEKSLKSVVCREDEAAALDGIAKSCVRLGNIQRAVECYLRQLEIFPDSVMSFSGLSQIADMSRFPGIVARFERSIQPHDIRLFALGKSYDDIGDTQKAFDNFQLANELRKDDIGYSLETEQFSQIKELFSLPIAPVESPVSPIFIVGLPRSGTSLVEQILASHPDVYGGGEIQAMHNIGITILNAGYKHTEHNSRELQRSYLEQARPEKPIFTDKLPNNHKWIGLIFSLFPNAKVIHVKRHPVAVCWSIFRRRFAGKGNGYAYDLDDIAGYYRLYTDLMAFWSERFPIYDLQYETLTEDQEGQTRALLEYCGLPWDDACLRFYDNPRPVQTASAAQVRKPMYQGSSEAWKRYERYLGPILGLNP